jgi:hypothetical protein
MRGLRIWAALGVSVLAAAGLVTMAAASSASGAVPTEHIVGLQNNPTKNGLAVIIGNGPIHAHGRDVVVNGHTDKFVFPKGSITIKHRNTSQHQHFDKVTCYGTFIQRGTYKVTGGTGAYSGASGHGKFVVRGVSFGCSQHKPPRIFQLTLHASGPLSV